MCLFVLEERILVVRRRDEVLFDCARRSPADHVMQRAGFVVGAGSSRAAKWLLADDSAGRFIIDIEIAGRLTESSLGEQDGVAICGEDSSGQRIR